MIVWVRPSGAEITTNEEPATREHALTVGWVPREELQAEVDVRGIMWDERLHTANRSKTDTGVWKYRRGVNAEAEAALLEAEG